MRWSALVLSCGCFSTVTAEPGVGGPVWGTRPVLVYVDPTLPDECLASADGALEYWGVYAPYLERVEERWDADVVFGVGDVPSRLLAEGTDAVSLIVATEERMYSCEVSMLPDCESWKLAAHELGHCLGLVHVDGEPENLMAPTVRGVELTEEQVAFVR